MPLHLPDFRQEFLRGLSYCSVVHADDGLEGLSFPYLAFAEYDVIDGKALLVVQIEPSDDDNPDGVHFHYHVDVDCTKFARRTTGIVEKPVDELKEVMERVAGLSATAFVEGKYAVAAERLPSGGIIRTLLNVSMEVGNMRLAQRGSKFFINDDEYFRELIWRVDDLEDEDEYVCGRIEAAENTILDDSYLVRNAEKMQRGIEALILEIEVEENDATDSDTEVSDTKKKAAGE